MQRCLFAGVGLLSLVAAAVPVFAAELPVSPRPRAAPARAPAPRPAPAEAGGSGACAGGPQLVGHAGRRLQRRKQHVQCHGGTGRIFASSRPRSPVTRWHRPAPMPRRRIRSRAIPGVTRLVRFWVTTSNWVATWSAPKATSRGRTARLAATSTQSLRRTYGSDGPDPRTGPSSFNGTLKQTWDSSLRARVGFLYSPWTLIYATGGVAFGEVSGSFGYSATITYPGFGTTSTSGGASWSDTRVGWTAGGGVETEDCASG